VAQRPDIVLITCHDLGRHLGCYGQGTVHTPILDEIAAGGVRFSNSFCTSPGCSPSRAALATGRYPHCNGVLGLAHAHFGWGLAPGERHAAALLAEGGYHTVLFGLQHVTYDVQSLGFREVRPDRSADAVARNVAGFVTGGSGAPMPFYLEINFFEPHRPFDFGGVAPDASGGVRVPSYLPSNEEARAEFALMQGAIRKVDQAIGNIRNALGASGRLENTLFLFTADHGIAFPRAKGTLYDAGIETALIVAWPAGRLAGEPVPHALVSNIDILPTLLEVARTEVPGNIQGRSFRPLISGGDYAQRDCVFAEKTFHNEYDPLRCIRTRRHKLIVRLEVSNIVEAPADVMRGGTYPTVVAGLIEPRADPFELYDLEADPLERKNLAGLPEMAEVETDLRRRLYTWMHDTGDPLLAGPVASPFYHRTVAALRSD
jgi:N-sulfoglucosamine sulfohydrolase